MQLRYQTQDELMAVAREYKKRNLPLSVIVADYFHWTKQGDWQFDPACWPDPKAMVDELKSMGMELMVSFWPTVNRESKNYDPMWRRGFILRTERGVPAQKCFTDTGTDGPVYLHNYDPSNPDARKFVWDRVREGYIKYGIKVFWLDACEPELDNFAYDNLRFHQGSGREVACLYPFWKFSDFAEGLRERALPTM